jgi:preprotein translocase SecE subunit
MAQRKEKTDYILAIRTFFSEVYAELKKIVWPTTETLVQSTTLVVSTIIVLSVLMFGADLGLNALFKLIE